MVLHAGPGNGRGKRLEILPRSGCEERLDRAQRKRAAQQPGRRGRNPACSYPLQLSAGAIAAQRRADRLVRAATYGRLHRRNRRDEARAASACRGPLLRLRPERRPDIARGAEPRHLASPQRAVPQEIRLEVHRYRRGARRLRPLDEDLRGHHLRAKHRSLHRCRVALAHAMKPELAGNRTRRRAWRALLAVASLCAASPVFAQDSRGVLAGLAAYDGVDRQQRLLEGARREGFLALYTSFPPDDVAALNAAFGRKHGVKVRTWRAASEKVFQRILAEARAGRDEVDVVDSNSVPLEILRRESLLQQVRSPHHADLIPVAVPAHRACAWARLSVFVQAYNTRLVKKAELPASYGDLLHPRWKGRLGIEASDEDWFAEVVRNLGEEKGLRLFRDLAAKNGLSVRTGHSLLAQMVASGEVPFALTVYNFTAERLKRQGAPLEWFMLSPAVAHGNGFAVPKRAPHPHAALLYYEFMIGDDGQRILADRESVPTSRKIHTALDRSSLKIIDPVLLVDQSERWAKLYEEIIVKGSR